MNIRTYNNIFYKQHFNIMINKANLAHVHSSKGAKTELAGSAVEQNAGGKIGFFDVILDMRHQE
jgi:hypothetical protein